MTLSPYSHRRWAVAREMPNYRQIGFHSVPEKHGRDAVPDWPGARRRNRGRRHRPAPRHLPPEIVVGTWRAALGQDDGITEAEVRDALLQLVPLWDELFPAKQARIVQLLVERSRSPRTGSTYGSAPMGSQGSCASSVPTRGRLHESPGSLDAVGSRAIRHLEARRAEARDHARGQDRAPAPRIDSALVKAIARAHQWQRMLETGTCGSISELAEAEKINRSYVCRVLCLTLLAPEIVEAVLDGRQPDGVDLPALMKPFPVNWRRHRPAWDR